MSISAFNQLPLTGSRAPCLTAKSCHKSPLEGVTLKDFTMSKSKSVDVSVSTLLITAVETLR